MDKLATKLNAIPGFTEMSIIPRAAEASGWTFAQVLEEMVESARRRFKRREHLRHPGDATSGD